MNTISYEEMQSSLRPCPECGRQTTLLDNKKNWHCPRCHWTTAKAKVKVPKKKALTERQKQIVVYYKAGVGVVEMSRLLGIETHTIYHQIGLLVKRGELVKRPNQNRLAPDPEGDRVIKELYQKKQTHQSIANLTGKSIYQVRKKLSEMFESGELIPHQDQANTQRAVALYRQGMAISSIAEETNMSIGQVQYAIKGEERRVAQPRASDILRARLLRSRGVDVKDIAKDLNRSVSYVYKLLKAEFDGE